MNNCLNSITKWTNMNLFRYNSFLVAIIFFMAACSGENNLREQFKTPNFDRRPNKNLHHIPRDPAKQDSILDWYIRNGYGGMATNAAWTNDYLKNEKEIKLTLQFAQKAKSRGMNVWLYDEKTYPSGMAGGLILAEHPEWEAEGLFFKDTLIIGSQKVMLNSLPGDPVINKAIPVVNGENKLDQAVELNKSNSEKIEWTVPEGKWRIVQISSGVLREGFQAGTERGGKILNYPSLLLPEVTKRFIELTHKKYAEVAGEKLGEIFYATFTDEPSSMAQPYNNLGYGVYPWKENVSKQFKNRYGYKLKNKLLEIMLDEGSQGQKLRYQYFKIISEDMSQNYFGAIKNYLHTQNMKSSGHLLLEESLMAQVPLYGSIMACYRQMDIPGIDDLTNIPRLTRRFLYSSRLASSAAELEGNSEVMDETAPVADYPYNNGKEAPTIEAKATINRQLIGGVTRYNTYLDLDHANQQERKALNIYTARISTMLSGSTRASKIAVLYPIETMWTKFRPLPTWLIGFDDVGGGDSDAQKVEEVFDKVSDHLYNNRWEFSYIDTKALLEANVSDGMLRHGDLVWSVLILPSVETLPLDAWKVIEEFSKSGGEIIAIDALPKNSTKEFPSAEIISSVNKIFKNEFHDSRSFYLKEYSDKKLQDILQNTLQRYFTITPSDSPILTSYKHKEGYNVLFLINDSKQKQNFRISFRSAKAIEKWNPNTGKIRKLDQKEGVSLDAYDGILLRVIPQ